ncbi:MAG: D-lactate dehydrogenase [Patescibacteria group bacterium]|nr:D-lactate dehydrogenase [Patescibacteria group bacterium]
MVIITVMPIIHIYDAHPQDQESLQKLLAHAGELRFTAEPLSATNVDPDAEVISGFVSSAMPAELIAQFPKLKLIACRSTGFNHVDLKAALKQGLQVANVPTYGEHTVAEYTFTLLLALTRKVIAAQTAFAQGNATHDSLQGVDLYGKTFGLIGTGHIGKNVAAIAQGFGMKVVANDAFPDHDWSKQHKIDYLPLDKLLDQSDVVSLHIPYTKESHHLINESKLGRLKPTALLVNTARGELVDTEALITDLANNSLAGAALDVFEGENLVDIHNELITLRKTGKRQQLEQGVALDIMRKLPNLLVTNHNAFNTVEALGRINQTTADNITSYLNGSPQNLVKP